MGLGSVEEAAEGILAIVNENMAGALRLVSVQRGHDPRDFALVAYGGAGPLHANAVAKLMGSFPVIVPPAPGLLCAIGDLVADFRDEFAQHATSGSLARPTGRRGGRHPRRARRPGAASGSTGEGIDADARSGSLHGRHALPRPGLRDPGRARPGGGARRRPRRPRGALQRAARAALRLPHARARAREIVNLRAVGFGAVPKPELPTGELGSARTPSGAVVDEHEILFEGEQRADEDLRPLEAAARAPASRARRS